MFKFKPLFLLTILFLIGNETSANGIKDKHNIVLVPDGRGNIKAKKKQKRVLSRIVPAAIGYGIQYHGGPVLEGTNNIYYLLYGNWKNSTPDILTDFAKNLSMSPYFSINQTYSTNAQIISNVINFGGLAYDSYSRGLTLTDAQIYSVLADSLKTGKLPIDEKGIYFVLTSADVKALSGFCRLYCGWHTYSYISGVKVKYAYVGNPEQCLNTCAAQKTSPNNNPGLDAMVSIIAHELNETITDPYFNGWFDSAAKENADKCAWNFGITQTAPNGSKWNVKLGERFYLIQTNWINMPGINNTGHCGLN